MLFSDLSLCDSLLKALTQKNYTKPSAIQEKAIPVILDNNDLMAAAQTGTGKTAGFALPILEKLKNKKAGQNKTFALILSPTRELAAQVQDNIAYYGQYLNLRSAVVFGGVKINPQMMKLRAGVEILVATPGRLLDLHSQNAINFNQLEILVLDEADRMLDMGFIHDIKRILKVLPAKRQTLLFSATFSPEIRTIAKQFLTNPIEISTAPRNTTVASVEQLIYTTDKGRKSALLTKLIHDNNWQQVLVFSRTKHGANRITKQLIQKNITAAAIHGNKSQGARTKALADFKAGKVRALIATDIAARGIDIVQLPQVVNFDLPDVPSDYVHRIGRTGRAGKTGCAISLVSADEIKQLNDIERLIGRIIKRDTIQGFVADHDVPESNFGKINKQNKPKKTKPSANSKPKKRKYFKNKS